METSDIRGDAGEYGTKRYLEGKGYEIIKTNYRRRAGEIDIIAKDGGAYVFIEVKYRKNINFGYPREAVNHIKQERIKNVAMSYITENNLDADFRFDVIEIIGALNNIEHIENAF